MSNMTPVPNIKSLELDNILIKLQNAGIEVGLAGAPDNLDPKYSLKDAKQAIQKLYESLLPEKRNPQPSEESMTYEQRHSCNICGHDFGWKGYCPCLEYNAAIDQMLNAIRGSNL